MAAATGYAPPNTTAQVAGDYLSSSTKPSYGIGSSTTNYPTQTPSVSGGMGKGDKLSPGDITPVAPGTANVVPGLTGQMLDDIANGYLAKDQNGNWYNPRAPTGFEKTFDDIMPWLVAAATIYAGGEALLGAGGAGAGGGVAAGTGEGLAAVTPESLAYSTGQLTASNIGVGLADTAVEGASAGIGTSVGTLADVVVPVAGGAGTGAGLGAAASIAGSALAIPSAYTGGVDLNAQMPAHVNAPQGWSRYTPKNLISNQLQQQGLGKIPANIIGGAGQGSLISTIAGGDPWKGALGGGVATGVGEALNASGLGSTVSHAVGGGTTGDILGKTVVGGVAGGATSGLLGGNPVTGLESGAIGGGTSAGLTSAGLDPTVAGVIGSQLGKAATMPTSSSSGTNPLKALGGAVMGSLSDLPVNDLLTAGTGLYSANKADKANQGLINQITSGAQPFVSAGQSALKDYQNLSPQEQAQLNASITAGTTAQQGAQPLIGLGEQQLNIAGSGNLPPALETQLQQQIQAAKAQLAQQYSPDSSTYQQLAAKIDQQGLATRQQMLSQYQTSGQTTYNMGESQLLAGQQEIASAYAAAQKEIDQNLQNALSMATTGLGPLSDAVRLGLLNNIESRNTMSDLMKSIAGASVAGGGAGKTLGNLLGSIKSAYTDYTANKNLDSLLTQYGAPDNSFVSGADFFANTQPFPDTYVNNPATDVSFNDFVDQYSAPYPTVS